MGNDLKGKQLGKGLGQRKDGLYYARCRNYRGERKERCFKTLPEAKNWRQKQLYLCRHREWNAAQGPAKAAGSCQYHDHHEPLCSYNRRFYEKDRSAVRKGTGSTKRVSKSDLPIQRQIQFSQKTTYIRTI